MEKEPDYDKAVGSEQLSDLSVRAKRPRTPQRLRRITLLNQLKNVRTRSQAAAAKRKATLDAHVAKTQEDIASSWNQMQDKLHSDVDQIARDRRAPIPARQEEGPQSGRRRGRERDLRDQLCARLDRLRRDGRARRDLRAPKLRGDVAVTHHALRIRLMARCVKPGHRRFRHVI